jgi:hypothetical protein
VRRAEAGGRPRGPDHLHRRRTRRRQRLDPSECLRPLRGGAKHSVGLSCPI